DKATVVALREIAEGKLDRNSNPIIEEVLDVSNEIEVEAELEGPKE
ncbi:MAG: DNA-directed RNA polymerase subunit K/omega, partial [Francisellaceae bacterium]